jgi:hypothetical protein
MDGNGLFHVVTSYAGQVAISFQSCRDMMPDPGEYEACLAQSFAELRDASLKETAGAQAVRRRSASRKASGGGAGSVAPGARKAGAGAKAGSAKPARVAAKAGKAASAGTSRRVKKAR